MRVQPEQRHVTTLSGVEISNRGRLNAAVAAQRDGTVGSSGREERRRLLLLAHDAGPGTGTARLGLGLGLGADRHLQVCCLREQLPHRGSASSSARAVPAAVLVVSSLPLAVAKHCQPLLLVLLLLLLVVVLRVTAGSRRAAAMPARGHATDSRAAGTQQPHRANAKSSQ